MTRRRTRFDEQRRPADRRPRFFPGRRFAFVPALLLACSGGVASADVNSGPLVTATVYESGGRVLQSDSVSIGTLKGNQQGCPLYSGPNIELYNQAGNQVAGEQITGYAWSLATVLGCLQTPVPAKAVTAVTVHRQTGSPELSGAPESSQLSAGDLNEPSDFPNASEAPLIYFDGNNIIYDRPWRGGADANSGDHVEESDGSPFVIDVFEGPPLNLTATTSETTLAVGTIVGFRATVNGPHDGGLSYSWDFEGGAPSSTAQNPQVPFDTAGSYDATVQVTDAAGGYGSAAVQITVNPLTTTSPTTSTTPNAPPRGPAQSTGIQPGTPAGKLQAKQPARSGKGRTAKGAATGKYKPKGKPANHTATPTTSPTTTATPSASQGTSSGSGEHGAPASGGRATASRQSARAPTPRSGGHARAPVNEHSTPPASTTSPPPLVTGRLISDVTLLPSGASPLVHSAPASIATAPAERRPARASLLPILAVGLAILTLLSLGAGRELRGRRDWQALRFGT